MENTAVVTRSVSTDIQMKREFELHNAEAFKVDQDLLYVQAVPTIILGESVLIQKRLKVYSCLLPFFSSPFFLFAR